LPVYADATDLAVRSAPAVIKTLNMPHLTSSNDPPAAAAPKENIHLVDHKSND